MICDMRHVFFFFHFSPTSANNVKKFCFSKLFKNTLKRDIKWLDYRPKLLNINKGFHSKGNKSSSSYCGFNSAKRYPKTSNLTSLLFVGDT
jgi:hypothetical protein